MRQNVSLELYLQPPNKTGAKKKAKKAKINQLVMLILRSHIAFFVAAQLPTLFEVAGVYSLFFSRVSILLPKL